MAAEDRERPSASNEHEQCPVELGWIRHPHTEALLRCYVHSLGHSQ